MILKGVTIDMNRIKFGYNTTEYKNIKEHCINVARQMIIFGSSGFEQHFLIHITSLGMVRFQIFLT